MRSIVLTLLMVSSLGCADEFDSYFEVQGLRLLAVRADAPALRPGETSSLSAFVTEPGASYQWTWCPLPSGPANSYQCAVTEADLQAAADAVFGPGAIDIPAFDLGSDPIAAMTYSVPPELFASICEILLSNDLPEGVDAPKCETGFDIQIRVVVELDGESVIAVRDLTMLYADDQPANANPILGGLTATNRDTGETVELGTDASAVLATDTLYDLTLLIDPDSSELYPEIPVGGSEPVMTREELTATWFREKAEGGDLDKGHTGFIDGSVDFEILLANEWTTPSDTGETRLFVVLRDNRGGVDYLSRTVELVAP